MGWTKIPGWPGYRVYRSENHEEAKTLRLCRRGECPSNNTSRRRGHPARPEPMLDGAHPSIRQYLLNFGRAPEPLPTELRKRPTDIACCLHDEGHSPIVIPTLYGNYFEHRPGFRGPSNIAFDLLLCGRGTPETLAVDALYNQYGNVILIESRID